MSEMLPDDVAPPRRLPCFREEDSALMIDKVCDEHGIDRVLLEDLCSVQIEYSGSGRPDGINADISRVLEEFMARAEAAELSSGSPVPVVG